MGKWAGTSFLLSFESMTCCLNGGAAMPEQPIRAIISGFIGTCWRIRHWAGSMSVGWQILLICGPGKGLHTCFCWQMLIHGKSWAGQCGKVWGSKVVWLHWKWRSGSGTSPCRWSITRTVASSIVAKVMWICYANMRSWSAWPKQTIAMRMGLQNE